MHFTAVLTSVLAGLAVASPAARPDQSSNGLQQRQVQAVECIAACLASTCLTNPVGCATCLVDCVLNAANAGGEVVLDAIALENAVVDKVEGYVSQLTKA